MNIISDNKLKIQTVSIEGNIGSGKSTLLEELRVEYKSNKNIIFLKLINI